MLLEKDRQKRKELARHKSDMKSNTIMKEENQVKISKEEAVSQ